MSYLERYMSGEYEAVWDELTALGDLRDDETRAAAIAVAQETMQRVKANIKMLADRLWSLGFRFGEGFLGETYADRLKYFLDDAPVYGFANDHTDLFREEIARLETITGGLPISLRTFYAIIGSVNFVGTGPMWREDEPITGRPLARRMLSRYGSDPLFVFSPKIALQVYSDWQAAFTQPDPPKGVIEPDAIDIAPSHDYKIGIGGDGPYQIRVPSTAADAPLVDEWHQTTFVNYLRICCRWGGFPGLEHHRDRDNLKKMIADLTEGLIAF